MGTPNDPARVDFAAFVASLPIASESSGPCEWETRERERETAKRLQGFYESIPADYHDTTDSRKTPYAALSALFEANAGCGEMRFPVNEPAFRRVLEGSPSFYLYGDTGTGKTRAALRRAANGIIKGEWVGVRFVRFSEITSEFSKGMSPVFGVNPHSRRLLIIDDFLNSKPIASRKEAFAGELFTLIEARLMNGLPFILTANANPAKICEWFDSCGVDSASIVRRLGQKTTVIPF